MLREIESNYDLGRVAPADGWARENALAPWEAEPYRLWSPYEMFRHYAGNWMAVVCSLERLKWIMGVVHDGSGHDEELNLEIKRLDKWLWDELSEMPFSEPLKNQAKRTRAALKEIVGNSHKPKMFWAMAVLDEFKSNIQDELKAPLFLLVPSNRKSWYAEEDTALFGDKVASEFPESTPEISEAGRCFALARWTATVFHAMRALELALHRWARQLGVDKFSAIELENWKNILDAADKKIRQLEQLSKSPTKDAELQYYGETSGHYRSIKDAWRNHVSHSRTAYNEVQAYLVLVHVREFMILLASKP